MRCWLAVLLCAGFAHAQHKADEQFLRRQLQVLKLLRHIAEPVHDSELLAIKNSFNPLSHLSNYKCPDCVQRTADEVAAGRFIGRGEIFSLFHPEHRGQMVQMFEALHGATDFDTFLGTAAWLRDRVSPRQFLYAFSVALLHRPDCRGITLPPAYEITPHMFLTTDVVRRAYQAKMTRQPTVIPMKFTGSVNNPEQRVAYFGEDIGMNSHHAHWHMDFPFWWKRDYPGDKDRKGELFFYMHHQMVARFDAERLSNNLPAVEPLDFDEKIVEGFAPGAMYDNGQEFPVRPDGVAFQDLPWRTVHEMKLYEGRIRDAIAAGFIKTSDGLAHLNNSRGINLLGEIVESSRHSLNRQYYGQLHNDAHVLLSKVTDPQLKFGMPPGVMEHFETATRDPAFFRLHKHIDNLFKLHKDLLPPYTQDELDFPGVRVEAIKVVGLSKASTPNTLVTYFDESHIDLTNAVEGSGKSGVDIKAVVSRLNHEPFKYVLTVNSARQTTGVARIFLSPKYDWFGKEIPVNTLRWGVIELDRFPVSLTVGDNVIARNSEDSVVTIAEPRSFPELLREVQEALKGNEEFVVDKQLRHCGFPHRLLLPKGKPEGMAYRLFVTVTDYSKDVVDPSIKPEDVEALSSLGYCGVLDGRIPDGRPMGFPFDRPVASREAFLTPNTHVVDITIRNVK
ncbi:hemocyanin B chain-like isoform X2 [Bacillus rossius redtenbacheri]